MEKEGVEAKHAAEASLFRNSEGEDEGQERQSAWAGGCVSQNTKPKQKGTAINKQTNHKPIK